MGLHQGEIAHHVRFDSTVNQDTKVCLMTDGMMVQKLYQDPLLEEYAVIVLDDIHERSISYDILFGMLKKILQKRKKQLKVIITSATLEEQRLKAYFQKNKNVLNGEK
jgi:HrpA-like RNA helicase